MDVKYLSFIFYIAFIYHMYVPFMNITYNYENVFKTVHTFRRVRNILIEIIHHKMKFRTVIYQLTCIQFY